MAINPPRNLVCTYANGNLTATWKAPASGGSSYSKYRLHRYDCAKGGGCGIANEVCLASNVLTYTWTGLPAGSYNVHIRAMSACPTGTQSSSVISDCTVETAICGEPVCNLVVS